MAGIYDDMLAYFPELTETIIIFSMPALSGGGFGKRQEVLKTTGYLSRNKGGQAGFPDDTFNDNQEATLYLLEKLPQGDIHKGVYVEHSDQIFKIIKGSVFTREGNFSEYLLQLVVGNIDTNKPVSSEPIIRDF